LSLVAAVDIAVLGQAPAGDSPRKVVAPAGDLNGKTGTLSGKLTDLYSTPLDGATLVLRNISTGAEARAVTQKNGSYRFTGIPAGEYTLVAESNRLGQGSLEGIVVSPGTEARVQAAMDFVEAAPQPAEAAGSFAGVAGRRPG
jgi:hypothetical protein